MDESSLDERLSRWRVQPVGSAQLAGAVQAPGRPDPLLAWSAAAAIAIIAGGSAGQWANHADRQRVLELHVRQISDVLPE